MEVIDVMSKGSDPFEFEKAEAEGADDNYVGISKHGLIRLKGPADNLTEAIFLAPWTSPAENLIASAELIGFANSVDQQAAEWVIKEMRRFGETPKTDYENATVINGRKLQITISATQVAFVVTADETN